MTDRCIARVRRAALPTREQQLSALAAAVRRRRQDQGLTQRALADHAKIDRELINRLEAGEHAPRLDTLWRIAAALGTCPSALLGDAEDALDGGGRAVG